MVCDVGGGGAEKRARGMAALAEPLTDDEIAELRKRVHTVVAPGIGHVAFLVDRDLVVRLLDEVEGLRVRDVETRRATECPPYADPVPRTHGRDAEGRAQAMSRPLP